MATVVRKGIVCEHCGKFLDFSYGTESAVGVLCLYCRGYVEIRDDLLVTLSMETTNMADTTGHTPLPWTIGRGRRWITSGEVDIARIHDVSKIGEDEAVANARLIASAPELLEALEEYDLFSRQNDNWFDGDEFDVPEFVLKARAAIAKAKGGD